MKNCKWSVSAVTLAAAFLTVIATCGSASAVTLLSENFDSVTPSSLPAGWNSVVVSGSGPVWATKASTRYPIGQPPASPPNLVFFNSYSVSTGSARLYYAAGLDTTPYISLTISFQMYHDPGYTTTNDRVQVQVSTNGDTWVNAGDPVSRYSATPGWVQHEVNLDAYVNMPSVRVGLLGISEYGNDCHVDDIVVSGALPNMCSPTEGKWTDTFTITGGTGFGATEGSVLLGGTQIEVLSWTNESIVCRIDQPMVPGLKDVQVNPAAPPPITMTDAFTVLSSCTLSEGTAGTLFRIDGEGFGDAKGKVTLKFGADKPIALKVKIWGPEQITCQLSKYPGDETFDVVIQPKAKSTPPILLPESFEVKEIEVDAPDPNHGPAGTPLAMAARYHGLKKGKVSLYYSFGGVTINKSCKVLEWSMDEETNAGLIRVEVPRKLPAHTYNLNVVGPGGIIVTQLGAFTYETP